MAMSGLRDMSVIEEAPLNRQPVQTYVLEHDDAIIYEAVRRELRRGGQVFYLHNNVETIESCANRIREAIPEAKIAIGHGKMSEQQLSEVWRQMLEQEIDILVCTTIIETGVDLPNANTLIIENAAEWAEARAEPTLTLHSGAARCSPTFNKSALPQSGSSPSSAAASKSRCATSSCAAQATLWVLSSTVIWRASATICT